MSRHDRLWFEARTATRHSSSSPLCYILEHFLLVPYFFLSCEEIADSRGNRAVPCGLVLCPPWLPSAESSNLHQLGVKFMLFCRPDPTGRVLVTGRQGGTASLCSGPGLTAAGGWGASLATSRGPLGPAPPPPDRFGGLGSGLRAPGWGRSRTVTALAASVLLAGLFPCPLARERALVGAVIDL